MESALYVTNEPADDRMGMGEQSSSFSAGSSNSPFDSSSASSRTESMDID